MAKATKAFTAHKTIYRILCADADGTHYFMERITKRSAVEAARALLEMGTTIRRRKIRFTSVVIRKYVVASGVVPF